MISVLGRLSVMVGLAACSVGAVSGLVAGARKHPGALKIARVCAYVFFAALWAAALLMEVGLLTDDFSVSYVAKVGSTRSPVWVKIVSLWASLDGSILLWGTVLGTFAGAFAWRTRNEHPEHTPWALGMILAVGVFFTFLIAGLANPFQAVPNPPMDGPGPNALLQNHILMVVHPPLLYLGYVGMTVPFGMATAALFAGRLDAAWMRLLRRWTLVPWGFLTAGIIVGGWWSYEVLGWGGAWAWDPVENASFLPWLTATAYIHSAMVMERKGHLKGWTVVLVMVSFLLTILGTFMTRSGVFNSVHSFTQTPIGPVFLGFLFLSLLFSVVLLALRVDYLAPPEEPLPGPVSRELAFLFNNLLFVAFTFTVLLGTTYPMIKEYFTEVQVSVGEPYFNRMAGPIGSGILLLMGVGPTLPWGRASSAAMVRLVPPAVGGVVAAAVAWLLGGTGFWMPILYFLAGFCTVVTLRELAEPVWVRARSKKESLVKAAVKVTSQARRRVGGYVVHLGVVMVVLGVTTSSAYRFQGDLQLTKGTPVEFGAFAFELKGIEAFAESNRDVTLARIEVTRDGRHYADLAPATNRYPTMSQPVGTPSVHSNPLSDVYSTLIAVESESKVTIQVVLEPLVWWMWFGGGVMALGTLVAVWPRRGATAVAAGAKAA